MNREQRRRAARLTPPGRGQNQAPARKFQMRYGHDGQRVHLVMPFQVQDLVFSPAEAEAHIAMMQGVLAELQKARQDTLAAAAGPAATTPAPIRDTAGNT